jgi:Domain of unknown function (DUF4190)
MQRVSNPDTPAGPADSTAGLSRFATALPTSPWVRLNSMTAPGGASGEGANDDEANPPPPGGQAREQPAWEAPGDSPAPPPAADYPPPPYPPPSYPPGYPAEYPPPAPPPGYQPPPGYGGPPYPPGPPQFGGPPSHPGQYPGGYYPTPDYEGGYGPSQPGMNGLAIASLISSFTGLFCCIGGILGIVLGTIALDQIKRSRQEGYGLAVAGIVIGIATLIVSLIVAIFALHSR